MKNLEEVVVEDAPKTQSDGNDGINIEGPIDNLEDMQINSSLGGTTRKKKLTVSKSKPNSKKWLWINDNPKFSGTYYGYEDDVVGKLQKEVYFVNPRIAQSDQKILDACFEMRIFTYLTKQSLQIGLWCLKLTGTKWHETGLVAAEMGMKQCIRITSDTTEGCYETEYAIKEPPPPDWDFHLRGMNLQDMINLAFRHSYIGSHDHQIIKDLLLSE